MFFHYSQNNSGGSFRFVESTGLTHHMVIEAANAKEANHRAESLGLYWDGCEEGMDCPCCGDRWYPCSDSDGTETPKVYSSDPDKLRGLGWMKEGREVAVHRLDGTIEWYGVNR